MIPVTLRDMVVGDGHPIVLMAGPCVVESEAARDGSGRGARRHHDTGRHPVHLQGVVRQGESHVGPSRIAAPASPKACACSAAIKQRFDVPIVTDIHEVAEAAIAAEVADVLQIPAFLSRQTDLIVAAARDRSDRQHQEGAVSRARRHEACGREGRRPRAIRASIVTERGTSFGYHNLVVDMRGFPMMREQGIPVIFDVTHSLQLPGAGDGVTAGLAQYITPLASAGVAAGVDGIFLEVHEEPSRARSDAQNALRLDLLEPLLRRLMAIDAIVKVGGTAGSAHGAAQPRG